MADEIQADYIPGGALDHYAKDEAGDTWYPTGQVFEAWGTSGRDATNYAIAMVGDAGGNFVGNFDTNTSAGHYYVTAKIRAGASAANDDAVHANGEIWWDGSAEQTQTEYELLAYDPPTNTEMITRTIPSADYVVVTDTLARVTLVDTTTENTDMRGTDGANTVVPDVAGTAAGLHTTTDGKIDVVDGNVDDIKAVTLKLDTTLEEDGSGIYRFTANALEEGTISVTTVTWDIESTVTT